MEHNFRAYLYDMIIACQNLTEFTADLSFEAYRIDTRTKAACERMFEIIGEALRRLKGESPHIYGQIPDADHIIAFRNIIAHGYDILDDQLVWFSIKNEVQQLKQQCEELRTAEPSSGADGPQRSF